MKTIGRKTGFIGGGRITNIILTANKKHCVTFDDFMVYDPDSAKVEQLINDFPGLSSLSSPAEIASECDIIFLAVHPPVISEVAGQIKDNLGPGQLLVSLSPKITMEEIKNIIGQTIPMARIIPNAPSVIGMGYNAFTLSENIDERQQDVLMKILRPLGLMKKTSEENLEAYATISGMGPTFLWFLFNEFYQQAVKCGLSDTHAKEVVNKMIIGASETLFNSDLEYRQVLDLIPSYPMKQQEETIRSIFAESLEALYAKLSPSAVR